MTTSHAAKAPSLFWTLTEGRAIFELQSFYAMRLAMKMLPKGDGHAVLVLPGFVASDLSTRPLRGVLKDLGYEAHGWGLGRNLTFNEEREQEMTSLLDRIYQSQGRPVSIIGWSLGGVFARELAKWFPEKVRSVISLGSPISANRDHSSAKRLFEAINGEPTEEELERFKDMQAPPPVPCTSIYTKTDGIVHWHGSLQESGPQSENIEVPASHIGIGVNPIAIYAIADRLAQAEGAWTPFDRSGWRKMVFPRPETFTGN